MTLVITVFIIAMASSRVAKAYIIISIELQEFLTNTGRMFPCGLKRGCFLVCCYVTVYNIIFFCLHPLLSGQSWGCRFVVFLEIQLSHLVMASTLLSITRNHLKPLIVYSNVSSCRTDKANVSPDLRSRNTIFLVITLKISRQKS